jgi:hypothetical protein
VLLTVKKPERDLSLALFAVIDDPVREHEDEEIEQWYYCWVDRTCVVAGDCCDVLERVLE